MSKEIEKSNEALRKELLSEFKERQKELLGCLHDLHDTYDKHAVAGERFSVLHFIWIIGHFIERVLRYNHGLDGERLKVAIEDLVTMVQLICKTKSKKKGEEKNDYIEEHREKHGG